MNASPGSLVLTEVDCGVGLVTLNRPLLHNLLDASLAETLIDALDDIAAHPTVRVIVLSALGDSFSIGADLLELERAGLADVGPERAARLLQSISDCARPVVARVHGPAYGLGAGLLAACDIAIASFDAQFAFENVRIGRVPAVVAPYLAGAIGPQRTRRYLLTGERFSASEAYRIGLLSEIVASAEHLDAAVGEVVDALLLGGPHAQQQIRTLVRGLGHPPIDGKTRDDAIEMERRIDSGAEAQEGLDALLARRRPGWVPGGIA